MIIQGIKSNTFLPLAIQTHQFFHAIARFLPLRWICNHFSIIIGGWEYEAVAKGVVKRRYTTREHHYVKEWNIPLTPIQEHLIIDYLDKQVGKKYEVANFWFHILRIWFGKWFGSTTHKQYSCIELVNNCLVLAGIQVSTWDSPYETQVRLERLYGGQVIQDFPKGWRALPYWATPIMKLFMTILVIYLFIKGILFVDIHVTHFF